MLSRTILPGRHDDQMERVTLTPTLSGWSDSRAKRLVDVMVAVLLLVPALPMMAIVAALIKLTSPGPVLFQQVRYGRAGYRFRLLKFRSMRHQRSHTGPGLTSSNDTRVTPVGRVIRKWKLDELPQLFNVIRGEMSLVGPRPERPELVATFKRDIPHYNARHNAKPGITGWAQVNGLRGNTDLAQRINFDLWYMENWSAILDFQIMCMTFFKHRNPA